MPESVKGGYSAHVLKLIAIVSMLIDHIGEVVYKQYLAVEQVPYREWLDAMFPMDTGWGIYYLMRSIGRLAFPIFCFFLVEGYEHTSDRIRYAASLLIFGLISEIPFDLALWHGFFVWDHCNVMFTLFLGLLAIWGIDEGIKAVERGLQLPGMILVAAAPALALLTAKLITTDYAAPGVLCIILMYLLRNSRVLSVFAGVLILTVFSHRSEAVAFLDVILIMFYNGTRGRQVKYFFYAFYPLHFLILAGIAHYFMNVSFL